MAFFCHPFDKCFNKWALEGVCATFSRYVYLSPLGPLSQKEESGRRGIKAALKVDHILWGVRWMCTYT